LVRILPIKEEVMNNRQRWAVAIGALLLAAIVGAIAFNVGVNQGLEESGKVVTAPAGAYPYPHYGWHRPWGFGFFFIPFFFILFWFVFARAFFWRRGCYSGRLDDWHRRAHERMWNGEREQDDPDRRR
jgi:hypothetical protein